jgi:hypothetical protein
MALTPRSVFRYFKTDGVPSSGEHNPVKAEIIQLLEQIFGVSRGGWVVTQTLAELNGVTPENETDGGVVLADPDPANNGYYSREAGAWVKGRGFPDSVAVLTSVSGSNTISAAAQAGVDPSEVRVFILPVASGNTGPVTLSVSGETPKPVLNRFGSPLGNAELMAGEMAMLLKTDTDYRLLTDSAFQSYFRGAWSGSGSYVRGDLVENGGSIWLSLRPSTNVEPVEGDDWTLFLPGVTVADESVTTPKLATAAVTFAKLADTAYDWPKAFGAAPGNAAAVNDAAFAGLESVIAGRDVDLGGKVLTVSSAPIGNTYQNGFFRIEGAAGNLALEYTLPGTLETDYLRLSQGWTYQAWTQDKCHEYLRVIYAVFLEAPSHSATSGAIKMMRSLDGGHSFVQQEVLFRPSSGRVVSWSAGVFNGQQFIVVQTQDSGGTLQSIKLYGRRLFEFFDQQELRVQTFNGSSTARVYVANAGVKPGDKFEFVANFGTVAGISLSGEFEITDCRNNYFEINLGSNANADTDDVYIGRYCFPEGEFEELLFEAGGTSDFGTFLVDNTSLSSLPTLVHSFASRRVSGIDAIYLCISSGSTDALLKVSNIFRKPLNRSIDYLNQLPGAGTDVSEPTVCTDGTDLFGFLRHQNDPDEGSAKFWYSEDDGQTFSSYDLPAGREVAYFSPIPVRVYGDYLIAMATGDRMAEHGVDVPTYMLVATKADAKAGWSAWRAIYLGDIPRTRSGSSAIGVPSMAISGNKAFFFFSAEEYPQGVSATDQGVIANTFCLTVDLGFLGTAAKETVVRHIGPKAIKPARLAAHAADQAFFEEVRGSNSAVAWGQIAADGTIIASYNVESVSKGGTGIYVVTFKRPISGIAAAIPTARWTGNQLNAGVSDAPTATGFGYRVRNVSDTLTDAIVHFVVYARDDRYRDF